MNQTIQSAKCALGKAGVNRITTSSLLDSTARRSIVLIIVAFLTLCPRAMPGTVSAGGKVAREIAEALAEAVGRKGSKEFVETTTKELDIVASKCGKESLDVIDNQGVRAFRVLRNAGDDAGPYLVNAVRVYGDDAIRVAQTSAGRAVLKGGSASSIRAVARHTDEAIPLIQKYGDDCAGALADLSPSNGRRLIQMEKEALLSTGDMKRLMPTIRRYGDESMDFIWRNRKPLASAVLLTAFVLNPEPYLKGAKSLLEVAVTPIGQTVMAIVERVRWNLWIGVALIAGGLWFFLKRRSGLESRSDRKG